MKYSHNTLRDIASMLCLFPYAQFKAKEKNNFRVRNSAAGLTFKSAAELFFISILHFIRLIINKVNSFKDAVSALYNQVIYRLIYAAAEELLYVRIYISANISYHLPYLINSCLRMAVPEHQKNDNRNYSAILVIYKNYFRKNLNTRGTFLPCY